MEDVTVKRLNGFYRIEGLVETTIVIPEVQARNLLSCLIDSVGLHYFVSNEMLAVEPKLFSKLETVADMLAEKNKL